MYSLITLSTVDSVDTVDVINVHGKYNISSFHNITDGCAVNSCQVQERVIND